MNAIDQRLFMLLHAPAPLTGWRGDIAIGVADYLIYLVPAVLAWLWLRGSAMDRSDLNRAMLAAVLALGLGALAGLLWSWLAPAAIDPAQSFAVRPSARFVSGPVLALWALALSSLYGRRGAWVAMPLLATGLAVGWAQVYVGAHLPFDVAAALPIAAGAAKLVDLLRDAIELRISAPLEVCHQRVRAWTDGSRLRMPP